ncbi:hypothetical protein C0R09_20960 [Brevibacillus laterosporus]|uniref:DUF4367 domain-containing protein n=1 Tax=Brevibacillus laterosporus TaxID=1465 RepID=UPI000C780E6D|nr:DUF4367 domain-containing protein [Brevibacillus laterosporus]AUM66787.1 hypothetical protein C0R09_20960 [Brevibacillus laterosporus]
MKKHFAGALLTLALLSIGFSVSANVENKSVQGYKIRSEEPSKVITLQTIQNDLGFIMPKYVPESLTLKSVVQNDPPREITASELQNRLKTYDIFYSGSCEKGKVCNSLYMIVTEGNMHIGGAVKETEINGSKAEIQENENVINLSWKYKGLTYWVLAKKSETLTREEVLKFANSIVE